MAEAVVAAQAVDERSPHTIVRKREVTARKESMQRLYLFNISWLAMDFARICAVEGSAEKKEPLP